MPAYKLTYFNITGLGEPLRFLLHQAGVEFEDVRYSFDEWPKHKAEMPMGQLPVLEFDGKKFHQSKAIGRYIARKHNLYGANEIEALEIDSLIDTIEDLRVALSVYYWEQDPAIKAKNKETAFKKLPFYLDKLEEQVKKNGGHFIGGKLTWPDIYYSGLMDYLAVVVDGDMNKNHPELKKLVEKVKALPKIKAYLDKRPKTQL